MIPDQNPSDYVIISAPRGNIQTIPIPPGDSSTGTEQLWSHT